MTKLFSSPVLVAAHDQILGVLADSPGFDTFLHSIAQLAADVVSSATACGITVRREGNPITVASSGPLASNVDEIQYGADEGPCLDALRTGEIVEVRDLTRENR